MKHVLGLVALLGGFFPSLLFSPSFAQADGGAELRDLVCIEIFPCHESTGELLPDYEDPTEPCYDYWLSQCLNYQENLQAKQLFSCVDTQRTLERRLKNLAKKNRRLKGKLRGHPR